MIKQGIGLGKNSKRHNFRDLNESMHFKEKFVRLNTIESFGGGVLFHCYILKGLEEMANCCLSFSH